MSPLTICPKSSSWSSEALPSDSPRGCTARFFAGADIARQRRFRVTKIEWRTSTELPRRTGDKQTKTQTEFCQTSYRENVSSTVVFTRYLQRSYRSGVATCDKNFEVIDNGAGYHRNARAPEQTTSLPRGLKIISFPPRWKSYGGLMKTIDK